MSVNISDVLDIVNSQNQWRGKEAINLIASENVQSDAVKQIESNDFMGRYAEGHPNTAQQDNRYYEGTRYIDQIESMTTREIIQLAKCLQADVRPLSGNAANTAVALGILRGGDTVLVNSIEIAGHISHNPFGVVGREFRFEEKYSLRDVKTPSHCISGLQLKTDIILMYQNALTWWSKLLRIWLFLAKACSSFRNL